MNNLKFGNINSMRTWVSVVTVMLSESSSQLMSLTEATPSIVCTGIPVALLVLVVSTSYCRISKPIPGNHKIC